MTVAAGHGDVPGRSRTEADGRPRLDKPGPFRSSRRRRAPRQRPAEGSTVDEPMAGQGPRGPAVRRRPPACGRLDATILPGALPPSCTAERPVGIGAAPRDKDRPARSTPLPSWKPWASAGAQDGACRGSGAAPPAGRGAGTSDPPACRDRGCVTRSHQSNTAVVAEGKARTQLAGRDSSWPGPHRMASRWWRRGMERPQRFGATKRAAAERLATGRGDRRQVGQDSGCEGGGAAPGREAGTSRVPPFRGEGDGRVRATDDPLHSPGHSRPAPRPGQDGRPNTNNAARRRRPCRSSRCGRKGGGPAAERPGAGPAGRG